MVDDERLLGSSVSRHGPERPAPLGIASDEVRRRAGAIVASCLAVVAVLTVVAVRADGPTALDSTVSIWVAEHRTQLVLSMMRVVTTTGSFTAIVVVGVVAVVWGLRRADLRPAAFVVATALVASWTTNLMKYVIARPRPGHGIATRTFFGSSFPSGHATTAAALWGAVAVVLVVAGLCSVRTAVALWSAVVVLVCTSRVVLGAHWLSDVTAGAAVGTAWMAAAVLIAGPSLLGPRRAA